MKSNKFLAIIMAMGAACANGETVDRGSAGGAAVPGGSGGTGAGGLARGGSTTAPVGVGGHGSAGAGSGGLSTGRIANPDAAVATDGNRADAANGAADSAASTQDTASMLDALPSGQCRSTADCPPTVPVAGNPYTVWQCIASDQTAPTSYVSPIPPGFCAGSTCAVSWCGSTSCPTLPAAPTGDGNTCTTDADCPRTSTTAGSLASICSNGKCTECVSNKDCPSELPACTRIGSTTSPGYNKCKECTADADCPGAHPHCIVQKYLGGQCRDCNTTADCADGTCTSNSTCAPQCARDADCGNPAFRCSTNHRCEQVSCTTSSDCPADSQCQSGWCQRSPCTSASDCKSGICVNGHCYDTYGNCMSEVIGV